METKNRKSAPNNQSVVAIILARGGSKRLPKKNVKKLAGKPLVAYSIEAAKQSKYINRTVVFTDNKDIARISQKYGVEVFKEPSHLAQDHSKATDALFYLLSLLKKQNVDHSVVVFLQPTSPLRTTGDIDKAISIFLNDKCESVVSVFEAEHDIHWAMAFKHGYLAPLLDLKSFKARSQDLLPIYIPNGAIYVSSVVTLLKNKSFYTKKTLPYVMPRERSIDIDTQEDFNAAEQFLTHEKH